MLFLSTPLPMHYRFDEFEFWPDSYELFHFGKKQKLQRQPARLLSLLLGRHGQVVRREKILATLWGEDTFIDVDSGINFTVRQLRIALGDSAAEPKYVETVPRLGYRFVAEPEAVATEPTGLATDVAAERPARHHSAIPSARPTDSIGRWRTAAWIGAGLAAWASAKALGVWLGPTLEMHRSPKYRWSRQRYLIPLLVFLAWTGASAEAGPVEDALEAQWRGAFVVLKTESRSGCGDAYTNNPVFGARLGGRGEHRLPPGELGQVKKVDVKRQRVDLLLDLVEPLRISYEDGPFQLFRHAECRIELQFDIPRATLKKGTPVELRGYFSEVLERHETQSSVEASTLYNARRVEPFPEGYDAVVAEYEDWKAEQVEAAVQDRLAEALDAANRIAHQVHTTQSYSEGFTAGLRYVNTTSYVSVDCYQLLNKTFYPVSKNSPTTVDSYDSSDWQEGHRDGQALAFHLDLARGLARCIR